MTDLEKQIAAQLCNCTVEEIDQTARTQNGVLVVYFVSGKSRRFTQEQIDKALEQDALLVRTTLDDKPAVVTDVHHCIQASAPTTPARARVTKH